jgi:hypothetical protein
MSALPPKAGIGTQSWNVRSVPKADIAQCSKKALSFNPLIGAVEQLRRVRILSAAQLANPPGWLP